MDSKRPQTLEDWLAWQSALNPKRMDLGLDRVARVWGNLGAGALDFPVIVVGGTNGKGSCVALIESMAQAAGYTVACYSSPHLIDYNERIRIGGAALDDQSLCDAFARVEQARGDIHLTYFEFGTLAALWLFLEAAPDLAVLEVGLGGRLDAVNLVDGDVSVVTSIGMDHTDWLGGTLESIAVEKAGIFREGRPAVIGQPDSPEQLRLEARRIGANVVQLGREFGAEPQPGGGWTWVGPGGERLALPAPAMRGRYQYHNAAAAITALRSLNERLPLSVNAIRAGLTRVQLPGRFQVIPGKITWVLDVAHNQEAARALSDNLRAFQCPGTLRAVFGVLGDKVPESIIEPLVPLVGSWFLTQSNDQRAMGAHRLAARLAPVLNESVVTVIPDLSGALDAVLAVSAPGDCVLVFGSFTTVGFALARVGGDGLPGILRR